MVQMDLCPTSDRVGNIFHNENTPVQIYGKFHLQKTIFFSVKNSDIFHISAQNIDCGYSLEPPRPKNHQKMKIFR